MEIGCSGGHSLTQFCSLIETKGFVEDPSNEAVEFLKAQFPNLEAHVGFGDIIIYKKKFDLVHLVFFFM